MWLKMKSFISILRAHIYNTDLKEIIHDDHPITNIGLNDIKKCYAIQT